MTCDLLKNNYITSKKSIPSIRMDLRKYNKGLHKTCPCLCFLVLLCRKGLGLLQACFRSFMEVLVPCAKALWQRKSMTIFLPTSQITNQKRCLVETLNLSIFTFLDSKIWNTFSEWMHVCKIIYIHNRESLLLFTVRCVLAVQINVIHY